MPKNVDFTAATVKFGGCFFGGFKSEAHIVTFDSTSSNINPPMDEKEEDDHSFELHPVPSSPSSSNPPLLTVHMSTIRAQSWYFPTTESIEDKPTPPTVTITLELTEDPQTENKDFATTVTNQAGNEGFCCNCLCCCPKRPGGIMTLTVPISSDTFYKLSQLLKLNKGSEHQPNRAPLPFYASLTPPCCYSHTLIRCVDMLMKVGQMLIALFAIITLVTNVQILREWVLLKYSYF